MSVHKAWLVGQCGLWRESLEKVEQRLMERLCVEGIDVCLVIRDQFLGVNADLERITSGSEGAGCERLNCNYW